MVSVVPGERELEEAILELRTSSDVVDDPGNFRSIGRGDDHGDVRQFARDGAGDEVSRQVVCRVLRDGQASASTLEESLKIRHATVVDVFIGGRQAPYLWIDRKAPFHILMNELLEINTECPVSANDLVRANSGIRWHISPGIGQ